jgi:hypothetical protein
VKTPTTQALDHFDFYYGPMFGSRWPSVRLGLLSPKKFVAVLNNLCRFGQSTLSRMIDAAEQRTRIRPFSRISAHSM